mmetsp:Transcript_24894/g.52778  ORF Transcript_24894/g.52778 Transcript_24894/m.52778 type:complete len:301 (+) Transcript_24894:218-1120(+)
MVHRAPAHLLNVHSVNIGDGHEGVQVLHLALRDIALLLALAVLPTSAFQEEPVDVHALSGHISDLVQVSRVCEANTIRHEVERQVVRPRRHLHVRGQEGHRVEEASEPDGLEKGEDPRPLHELINTEEEICEPGREQLQGRIGLLSPEGVHPVRLQVGTQGLHLLGDVQSAADAEFELDHAAAHPAQQHVHAIALLQGDDDEGRVILGLEAASHFQHVDVRRQLRHVAGDERLRRPNVSSATAAPAARDLGHRLEDSNARVRKEPDFSIGVEPEHLRHLWGEALLDVLHVVCVLQLRRVR